MPIYEFFCKDCNCIYSFFSRSINTEKIPVCPKCTTGALLSRQVSLFAVTGRASESRGEDDFPIDEGKMERAMALLEKEAGNMNE